MEKEKGRSVAVVGLGYVGLPIAVAFGKLAPVNAELLCWKGIAKPDE
ncbi:MAG: hypothetical protein WBK08_13735 [Nitrospira sp.]|jgi:hypothetical protein